MKNIKQFTNLKYLFSVIILIFGIIIFNYIFDNSEKYYETVPIRKASIKSVVNTSGTIEPQIKAELTPMISGIVKETYVDYNSVVKKGDILALIDPGQFELNLKQAEANFSKAASDLEYTQNIYDSNKKLYGKNLVSLQELNNSKVNYTSSLALFEQANVLLQKSQTDLKNTKITAPIDGIIIDKNIEQGQALSDRLDQKPVFTVINNLDDMNIVAPVNEVDIGKLSVGNPVSFVTGAYPEDQYSGYIKQIVSQPTSSNNIVSYEIIIEFENKNNALKPGMTANVEILARSKSDVLIVPKSALRFVPGSYDIQNENYKITNNDKIIWIMDNKKDINPVKVATGISDTVNVEITGGNVKADDRVVIGYINNQSPDNNSVGPVKIPGVKRF